MNQAYFHWEPGLTTFAVAFVVVLVFSIWSFEPNRTPLGWVLSVVWSLPVVSVPVGLQGATLLRPPARRMSLLTGCARSSPAPAVPTLTDAELDA